MSEEQGADEQHWSREKLVQFAFDQSWDADLSEPHCCEDGEHVLADRIMALVLVEQKSLKPHSVQLLKQVYDSLVAADPEWRLTITRAKRGKPIGRKKMAQQRITDFNTLGLVDLLTKWTGKREAAVAAICENTAMRRDEVFAALKRARAISKSLPKWP